VLVTHAHAVLQEAAQTTEGFTAQDACKTHQLLADDRLVARFAQPFYRKHKSAVGPLLHFSVGTPSLDCSAPSEYV